MFADNTAIPQTPDIEVKIHAMEQLINLFMNQSRYSCLNKKLLSNRKH